jgi:putative membrane protein
VRDTTKAPQLQYSVGEFKTMKLNGRFVTAFAAIALFAALSPAASWARTMHHKTSHAMSDKTFAMKAAEGGMAEVDLGNLAQQKASNPEVKQFGQRMVTDHSKANDDLKQVAGKDNITLPAEMSASDKALKSRLEKLSGDAFDRAYMEAMVKDHRADINEFKMEAAHGANPDIKTFASNTLPTLQDHLQQAEKTLTALRGGNKGTASRAKQ